MPESVDKRIQAVVGSDMKRVQGSLCLQVAYGKALEAQLKKQVDAINEEGEIKKKMLQQKAQIEIAQYYFLIEL